MKLLIHTQYFSPEVGAPQNRLFELAVRLQKQGVNVTILTAMPNYPSMEIHAEYIGKKYDFEKMESLKVHRSSIYVTKSKSIVKRLLNYFSFVWSSYRVGTKHLDQHYDFVLCESPPLFLGISSYFLAKKKKAKFIFNVSDLWPESAEKLGLVTNKFFLKMATILEEWLYKKSNLVTGQTQGIVENIKGRFPNKKVYWLPNGVDVSYYDPAIIQSQWREDNGFSGEDKLFLYAGIIGHAQGLEIILKAAESFKNREELKFILLGSGPCKEDLMALAKSLNLKNVYFYDAITKDKMPAVVSAVDVAIIPLKKLDLFKGAIPSKAFENLAMKVPILLGVDGEARELFINQGNAGLYFEPENTEHLTKQIKKLIENPGLMIELGNNGAKYVAERFNRNVIAQELHNQLKEI